MQFSTKIDGFEQNDSQGFENSYNSYEQYPLENFLIFTIYQNYTWALSLTTELTNWCKTRMHVSPALALRANSRPGQGFQALELMRHAQI